MFKNQSCVEIRSLPLRRLQKQNKDSLSDASTKSWCLYAKQKDLQNGKRRNEFINIQVCSEGSGKSQKFSKKCIVNMHIDKEGED